MTIDERLDRLTERHEALTQTVELLTRDLQSIRDFSKGIAEGTARLLHIRAGPRKPHHSSGRWRT